MTCSKNTLLVSYRTLREVKDDNEVEKQNKKKTRTYVTELLPQKINKNKYIKENYKRKFKLSFEICFETSS